MNKVVPYDELASAMEFITNELGAGKCTQWVYTQGNGLGMGCWYLHMLDWVLTWREEIWFVAATLYLEYDVEVPFGDNKTDHQQNER